MSSATLSYTELKLDTPLNQGLAEPLVVVVALPSQA